MVAYSASIERMMRQMFGFLNEWDWRRSSRPSWAWLDRVFGAAVGLRTEDDSAGVSELKSDDELSDERQLKKGAAENR